MAKKRLIEGYQPKTGEVTTGYGVTQQVDVARLKLPKSLRTAAITPSNGKPASAPAGAKKQ